jgi:uncharacterized protein YciI
MLVAPLLELLSKWSYLGISKRIAATHNGTADSRIDPRNQGKGEDRLAAKLISMEGSMARRFAYFYLLRREPERIQLFVPQHVAYWHGLHLNAYMGGPFVDSSGGLVTFEARTLETAKEYVDRDPLVLLDLLEDSWLREWSLE